MQKCASQSDLLVPFQQRRYKGIFNASAVESPPVEIGLYAISAVHTRCCCRSCATRASTAYAAVARAIAASSEYAKPRKLPQVSFVGIPPRILSFHACSVDTRRCVGVIYCTQTRKMPPHKRIKSRGSRHGIV